MTHYQVLGVAPGASAEEVRRAYLRLARAHHPDRHAESDPATRDAARRRMQDINVAWSVLGHERRRRAYDASLGVVAWRAAPDGEVVDGAYDDDDSWEPEMFEPGPPATGVRRVLAMAPVLLVGAALTIGSLWLFVGEPALLAMAVACGLLALVFFVVAPLVALNDARRNG